MGKIRNNIFAGNWNQISTKGQACLTLDRNLLHGPTQVKGDNALLADPLFVNAREHRHPLHGPLGFGVPQPEGLHGEAAVYGDSNKAMNEFIHDDFLLKTASARRLYHELAAGLPIIDYHNHLDPGELADDRQFENLTQLWIASDPYKHRAMRIAGVPERLITGDATDRQKFDAWAATLPQTLGNPLFHWTAPGTETLLRYLRVAFAGHGHRLTRSALDGPPRILPPRVVRLVGRPVTSRRSARR